MTEPNKKTSPILSLTNPWSENDNGVWLASTVSLYRNIEKFMFPGKLSADRQKQIISILSKEILSAEGLQEPRLIPAEEASPLEKEFLVEHFLSSESFQQTHSGEAFIIDKSGLFLTTLNTNDHIHMQMIECEGELENSWNKLVKLVTTLGKSVAYAFSPRFGFLTSDPTLCGTGMIATVFLQLPALIQLDRIDEVLDQNADETTLVTSIQGNPTEIIGDVLAFQNNFSLGVTEETIISGLRTLTTKVLVEENRARNEIRHTQNAHVKDQVSRAFGILIHSYQIEAVEALNAISLLKLGIEMGWVKGLGFKEINRLFFNCRRSHLLLQHGDGISQEEIPHKRAEFIHKALKSAQLMID